MANRLIGDAHLYFSRVQEVSVTRAFIRCSLTMCMAVTFSMCHGQIAIDEVCLLQLLKLLRFDRVITKKIRGAFGQCSSVQTVCRAINFIYILTELKKIAIKC